MSRQRTIAANFDERLRCPAGTSEEGRMEAACVVCARRFWAHELNKVLLFTDPSQAEGLPQLPDGVDAAVRPSQQHRLCRLLGVPRYAERWPHIALELDVWDLGKPVFVNVVCEFCSQLLRRLEGRRLAVGQPTTMDANLHGVASLSGLGGGNVEDTLIMNVQEAEMRLDLNSKRLLTAHVFALLQPVQARDANCLGTIFRNSKRVLFFLATLTARAWLPLRRLRCPLLWTPHLSKQIIMPVGT